MTTRIIQILLFALLFSHGAILGAQENPKPHWDAQKIKGVRHMPYPIYDGFTYLTDVWAPGKIEFTNGEIADSLFLKYSTFKDELIYYNKAISSQIVIDKASLSGFSFAEKDGNTRVFKKLYYDGFMKGEHYFEVLSKGETDLLVRRKVLLISTSPYYDVSGLLKNMAYTPSYQYYFYSPEKGYSLVRLNRNAFLSEFNESDQKPIKKLLRKNQVHITNEESLIQAWKIIEKAGYHIIF